jgi:hypothetical protein
MLAAIDLHGCESGRLADPDSIRAFVPAVINAIGMRAHGPLHLERFGDGELEGWSAMQFTATPASRSNAATCSETADGVEARRPAGGGEGPVLATSRSRRRRASAELNAVGAP